MIHVAPAAEPPDFDERVRQPGLAAIAELVGERPPRRRRGPRRKKVADRREDIPGGKFPALWREALPQMRESYHWICAYLSLYIEHGTGSSSVDHVVPKSKAWNQVYEWSNYRLACALMNSRKGITEAVLDPFEIHDDWFALELVAFQVKPGPGARGALIERVEETIRRLGLNDCECRRARREYVEAYLDGNVSLSYLERRAPFVAREIRRLGRLRDGDG